MDKAKYIWMDGKLVAWDDAKVHILTHTLHYGNGVFEGTRAYMTENGLAIFKLREHTKRLLNSAKITRIKANYTLEELEAAHIELLKSNDFTSNVYIRPLIYLGYGIMGLNHVKAPVNTAIAAWQWGSYLGDEGLENRNSDARPRFARAKRHRIIKTHINAANEIRRKANEPSILAIVCRARFASQGKIDVPKPYRRSALNDEL